MSKLAGSSKKIKQVPKPIQRGGGQKPYFQHGGDTCLDRGGCNACGTKPSPRCWPPAGNEWDDSKCPNRGCGFMSAGCQYRCTWRGHTGSPSDCCRGKLGTSRTHTRRSCSTSNWDNPKHSSCRAIIRGDCEKDDALFTSPRCQQWCDGWPDDCAVLEKGHLQGSKCSGSKIFTDNDCIRMCIAHSTLCKEVKGKYCSSSSNVESSHCKNFCAVKDNKAKHCDNAVRTYCNSGGNRNKPYCSCYKKLNESPGYEDVKNEMLGLTHCYGVECRKDGYMASSFSTCPPCIMNMNITNLSTGTQLIEGAEQSCGIKLTDPPAPPPPPPSVRSPPPPPPSARGSSPPPAGSPPSSGGPPPAGATSATGVAQPEEEGLSTGLIAGIVILGLVCVCVCFLVLGGAGWAMTRGGDEGQGEDEFGEDEGMGMGMGMGPAAGMMNMFGPNPMFAPFGAPNPMFGAPQ